MGREQTQISEGKNLWHRIQDLWMVYFLPSTPCLILVNLLPVWSSACSSPCLRVNAHSELRLRGKTQCAEQGQFLVCCILFSQDFLERDTPWKTQHCTRTNQSIHKLLWILCPSTHQGNRAGADKNQSLSLHRSSAKGTMHFCNGVNVGKCPYNTQSELL